MKDPVYENYKLYVSVVTQARMEKQRAMEAQRNKAALDRALAPPFRTEVIWKGINRSTFLKQNLAYLGCETSCVQVTAKKIQEEWKTY